MSLKLDRLQRSVSLVDRDGLPSSQFQIFWQRTMEAVENSINDLIEILTRLGVVEAAAEDVRIDLEETRQAPVILQSSSPKFANGYALSSTPTINFSFAGGLAEADFVGTTSDVPEGSRLYFTDVRARNALSGGTGISYNSGTGQIAVGANGVGNAQLRQSAAFSVIGRSGNTTGDIADITAASDGQVLRRSGSVLGFGAVDLSSAGGVAGILPASKGGTGVNNGTSTLTIIGGFNLSLTLGANSSLTLPASGTIATLAGTETLTNKTLSVPTITGTPVYSSTPGPNHMADLSAAAISLANGATVDFPNFSGPIFVNDTGGGGVGLYLCGGNNVLQVGASQPIGGTMAYNAGITGYTFTNTSGATRTFGFASTKLRAFS